MRYRLAILSVFSVTSLFAQDLKTTLVRMQEVYKTAENLHVVMEIRVFEEGKRTAPFYHEKADIKKHGTDYSYVFASTEMLLNDKYQIVVDKESKDIIVNRRDKKTEASYADLFSTSMDSILSFYDAPDYLGDSAGVMHYRIFQKKGEVDQIDLYINREEEIVQRMDYRYKEGHFVSVVFDVFDTSPSFDEREFDDRNYIVNANGRVTPSARLRDYKIFGAE